MLTQAEIDALLSGAIEVEQPDSQGGVNLAEIMGGQSGGQQAGEKSKQVRPYNFWSPDRFSKEQMRAVELVHEDLAERLSSTLPPYLHSEMRLRVVHIEQGRFDDFMRDLAPSSLYHLVNLDPLPGRIVIMISSEISWVILGRMLGGNAADGTGGGSGPITEIGQSLMNVVVGYMLNDIKAAWGKVVTLEPNIEDSTTNHHWVQMIMGNARVMLVTFEMAIGPITGTMSIYLPFAMLKPIAEVLNPHAWIVGQDDTKSSDKTRGVALDGLSRVALPIQVILGNANINISDLINLSTGDVIPLDSRADQDLEIRISGRTRFQAKPGKQGRRMAVQITSVEPVDLLAEEE